jgi:ankyrin repeat protein
LLQAGADPDAQQHGGYTALHAAAMHNDLEMAKALRNAGAAVDLRNEQGLTAAEIAARQGNSELASWLQEQAKLTVRE